MNRRTFLVSLGAVVSVRRVAEAQPAGKVYRIGFLSGGTRPVTAAPTLITHPLREIGYVEGQNLTIEGRYAGGRIERLPELAADLVRLNVDVIIVLANQEAWAAKRATSSIPIVIIFGADPVGAGLAASLARPGGNITGTTVPPPEIAGKMLELLKEIVPGIARVAVLVDPTVPGLAAYREEAGGAARTLGVTFQFIGVRKASDLEPGLAEIRRARPAALYVVSGPVVFEHRAQIVRFAASNRLPTIYSSRAYVDTGGLMSYGPNVDDLYRRAMTYVDKVLKGARPADLPVEQPTKFELAINLKTAKALGLTIPPSLLLRADQVIE